MDLSMRSEHTNNWPQMNTDQHRFGKRLDGAFFAQLHSHVNGAAVAKDGEL